MKGWCILENSEIKTKVTDILNNIFPKFESDTRILEYVDLIDELGMDSLTFIAIVVEIESSFNIIVPDEMLRLESFRNVGKIIEIVENAINSNKSIADKQEAT